MTILIEFAIFLTILVAFVAITSKILKTKNGKQK